MTIYFVIPYQDGDKPLHTAVLNNNVEVARVIINAYAKTNVPYKVTTCVHIKQTTNVYNNVNIYCFCTTH